MAMDPDLKVILQALLEGQARLTDGAGRDQVMDKRVDALEARVTKLEQR